jgi:hypothetical protein
MPKIAEPKSVGRRKRGKEPSTLYKESGAVGIKLVSSLELVRHADGTARGMAIALRSKTSSPS